MSKPAMLAHIFDLPFDRKMDDLYQLPPPKSWEAFESLCRDVFALEWGDITTKKHGRSGYPQHGVDVYGYTAGGKKLHGIQCKKKDVLTSNLITEKELRDEVKKAREFRPELSSFIFATTTPNDPHLERVARTITSEHKGGEHELFSVHFLGWTDILEKLSCYDELIKKYYTWAYPGDDPNNYAFELWLDHFDSDYLFENACYLPFKSHQVSFRPEFIEQLCSFCNASNFLLDSQRTSGLDELLRHAIDNFNKVAFDLIDNAIVDNSRRDAICDIYKYWVDKGNLSYNQQACYVEYKVNVLKCLFYNLIVAANYIVDVHKKISKRLSPTDYHVRFQDSFEMRVDYFPMYAEENVQEGILYPGLQSIKESMSEGSNDPVLEYEKTIQCQSSESEK